ncbi:MAG: endonuclease III [Pseudomonadota bacterium]
MARFAKAHAAPRGELDYHDPYTLLVAVVLSAQATDVSVNRATRTLFAEARTPEAMVKLGPENVLTHIRSIGLAPTKARHVIALSRRLLDDFDGQVPATREALESLPGVGRKTANVVLNIAFGQPTLAVDTHVFRVSNRTGLAPGKTPRQVEDTLVVVIPKRYLDRAHTWLILHGRYVCTARKPDCGGCVIRDLCQFEDKA